MSTLKYVSDLIYWVSQRELMRKMKEEVGALPPWSRDPIMANNRWCNVHREDDKVTRWIFEHFLPRDLSDPSIPFALCVARLVNWPDTLKDLGYPSEGWTPEYRKNFLDTFAARRIVGAKSWTGAYMVTGGFSAGGEGKEDIIARVLDGAQAACNEFDRTKPDTLAEASIALATPGMGPFLVAQVIADLKNTDHLRKAHDCWTWCAPGPGSVMGLNFMHGRERSKAMGNKQFMDEVHEIRTILAVEANIYLCAQNAQNCLCELSKYIRAKYFNERLKNSYKAVP